jgi:hypothetical protein
LTEIGERNILAQLDVHGMYMYTYWNINLHATVVEVETEQILRAIKSYARNRSSRPIGL